MLTTSLAEVEDGVVCSLLMAFLSSSVGSSCVSTTSTNHTVELYLALFRFLLLHPVIEQTFYK